MKTVDFIREHNACYDVAKWALSISDDMAVVWDALVDRGKHAWLLWTVTRPGVFPDSTLRKLACRFVRETPLRDGRKVWDLLTDERSRKAVYVAEAYADGDATTDELSDAYAAARDAADVYAAAYSADAAAYTARAAADADAYTAVWPAFDAAYAAARVGAIAAIAANADLAAARSAQVQMVAALGNPFKER